MSEDISTVEFKDLAHPKLRKIAKSVVNEVKLAMEKTIAHGADAANFPLPDEAESLERIFWERYNQLPEAHRNFAAAKIMPRVRASEATRQRAYKDLAAIDLRSKEPVAKQAARLPWPEELKLSAAELEGVSAIHGQIVDIPESDLVPQQTNDNLELRVIRVKCNDETDSFLAPEGGGNDEIKLGGTVIDATGTTQSIAPFTVGNNFDDGETKTFNPPRRFALFNLRKGTNFPKSYFVTFVLSEKDGGGSADFIKKLTGSLKDSVAKKLATTIGTTVGVAAGGPVGAAIGAVVGLAVSKAFDIFNEAIGDDVFKPSTVSLAIPSLAHTFKGGKSESPAESVIFKGHNGKYTLTYDWRVFA